MLCHPSSSSNNNHYYNPHQPPQQNFVYTSQTAPTVTPPVTANQCTTPTPAATNNVAANAAQVQSETVQQTGPETSETPSKNVGKNELDSPLAQPLNTSSDDMETVYLKLSKADLKRPEIKALIAESPEKQQQQATVTSSQISVKMDSSDVNISMTTDTSLGISPVITGTKTQQTIIPPQPDQTKVQVGPMPYPSTYSVPGNYPPAYFPGGEEVIVTSPYGSIPRVARR